MGMEKELNVGCQDLQASLRRIGELLSWLDLANSEKASGGPDSPRFMDSTQSDLQYEIAWFYQIYLQVENQVRKLPESLRPRWEARIASLWKQYRTAINRFRSVSV
jgi:hypothetical protein